MRKKIFCLILSCIMALGIMPASAFAEDTKVFQKAEITVEEPVIGEMPDYSKTITLTPSDFSCSIRVEWKKSSTTNNADYSGWEIMETGETFEAGFYYCVSYCITPNTDQGMVVYDFPEIYINNKLANTSMEGAEDLEIFATRVFSNLFNVVKNIDVTVDPPVVGEKPDYEPEFTSTPADSVSIKPEIIFWRECSKESYESYENGESDEIDWQDISKDDVFKEGYYYRIEVAFEPNENYFFTENTKTTVNDKSNGSPIFIGNDFSVACASATFTPLTPGPVTDIYVDVDPPVIGETPDFDPDYDAAIDGEDLDTTDIIELKDGVKWYEYDEENGEWDVMAEDDVFKDGCSYRIDTAFEPKTPYYFTTDTEAYVNNDDCELTFSSDNSTAYVSTTFGPLAPIPITDIRVTVDTPVIGDSPNFTPIGYGAAIDDSKQYDEVNILKLKDGKVKWYEYDEENDQWDVMAESDTFKAGYYYRIDAEFDPHTGYYFTTDTTATVNTYRHNGDRPVYDKDSTYAYVSCSFGPLSDEVIEVKSIAAEVDTPVIGETPDYKPSFTSDPEDSVEVYGVKWYKTDKENPSHADVFENPDAEIGKDDEFKEDYYYVVVINFQAKYGYDVSEHNYTFLDSNCTVNGMLNKTDILLGRTEGEARLVGVFEPQEPANVDEPITSIAVTFDEPALDGKLNFKPEITADPADSAYQISYSHIWFKCDKESYENDEILSKPWTYQSDGDVFEEGYYYKLDMYVKAHDGFYFTADTEGAINGVPYDVANYLADNEISFRAVYGPFSTEPITSIAAKVDAPVLGNTPDFSPEITSAPEGSAEPFKAIWYKLPEDKYTGTADDSWELVAQDEAFKEGYYYSVLVGAVENDGFCLSNDTAATLNGKPHVDTLGPVYSDDYEDRVARIYGIFEPLHSQSSSSGGGGNSSIYYKLIFDTNGGSSISGITKSSGTKIDLEKYEPEKEGFAFTGWYSDRELTDKITSIKLLKNTTVYAGWKAIEENPVTDEFPFADVDTDDWFFEDVAYVYENGLMSGTSADTFSPETATTRGMIVTILYRLEGEPEISGSCAFDDVKSGSYYENAITWAAANGIVSGYDNGLFGPDDAITREQLATILYRYTQYKGLDVSVGGDTNILSYNDALDISEYAVPAMQWLCGEGIMSGSDGNLMPMGNATRAQVAAFLHRFCENTMNG
ncbi:MAG: S-layer homology domain-containing protein [Bacteroidales bacterium]|nr:S-layer homology domain-containing protein [Bacteroidales bacterium]